MDLGGLYERPRPGATSRLTTNNVILYCKFVTTKVIVGEFFQGWIIGEFFQGSIIHRRTRDCFVDVDVETWNTLSEVTRDERDLS